jgi:hypothetical protein
MSAQDSAPLAGVLRVLFFLSVATLAVTAVATGVTTLYEAPQQDLSEFESEFGEFDTFFAQSEEAADYDRNVGLILGLIGTGVIALALLALDSRLNPLRSGLLAGGVGLVMAGVGSGSSGSDDWLTFLESGLGLGVLLACTGYLDNGLPRELFGGRRRSPPRTPLSGPPGPGGYGGGPPAL